MYASPLRSICTPTGVGQHIAHMADELATHPEVLLSVITARADYEQAKPHFTPKLAAADVHYMPRAERLLRAALISTNFLTVDRWTGDVDWIYSPKEQPVRTRRAKLAVTVHDVLPFETGLDGLRRSRSDVARWTLLMRRILERADLIATVSEFTRARLVELLDVHDVSRLAVVGNGIGAEYFQSRAPSDAHVLASRGLEADGYLICVGSLTRRKGGDLLLNIAERFLELRDARCIVVTGRRHDADLLAEYHSLKMRLPNLPLMLTGYVSGLEQAILVRNAKALVFPSRYEGFGIPVLESMAAGTPVICARSSALPEIAGSAAAFVDGHDTGDWLSQIDSLTADTRYRDGLILAGRSRANAFTWDRCAAKLVAAMQERT